MESRAAGPLPAHVPVLIAGGGPVGLTVAALLARYGIPSLVIEADDGYCTGSRAICISRRSLEILAWVGADEMVKDIGLSWTGGRSYFRDQQVLHFRMPSEPTERFAPMINIQQYHIEEAVDRALADKPAEVRWAARVLDVRSRDAGVEVDVADAGEARSTLRADWLIACDGGRSTVRDCLGLQLKGTHYEGRYVIVDIEQNTMREVERLAWFDPPSNPGSTILMHRQPGNIWRIDYQILDDQDPLEAVKPENVLPRVQSHLTMIGETAPWTPLWISIYNAKCLTLDDYRHGRVLFAGDAAHLVPIFGVRGLNSGLDDAGNLAWKLALVVQGRASTDLLDTYTNERLYAARQNIAYGAKSTEFMAPPHFGFRLMREAALRLAVEDDDVRSLINPRQSAPVAYPDSPLNLDDDRADDCADGAVARVGEPAPEVRIEGPGVTHLTQLFGRGFIVLLFSDTVTAEGLQALQHEDQAMPSRVEVWRVARSGVAQSHVVIDTSGNAWSRYGADEGNVILIRPDGYVMGRWEHCDVDMVEHALDRVFVPH